MFFSAVTSSSCLARINIVKSTQTLFGHSRPVTELFTGTLDLSVLIVKKNRGILMEIRSYLRLPYEIAFINVACKQSQGHKAGNLGSAVSIS